MQYKFTPSINIERDNNREFEYIHTPNSEGIISQIDHDFGKGIHCFSLIGSFGTGKSSFLLAFENELSINKKVFNHNFENIKTKDYEFLNIVAQYSNLDQNIKTKLKEEKDKSFLDRLNKRYKKVEKKRKGLIIVIDEFGKILEYASKNNPEKELYELQLLAEFVNDNSKNIILIISLHQAFETYSNELTIKQRDEWIKVKGRLQEIVFNEPVEQLLYLAAAKIQNGKENIKTLPKLLKSINTAKVFPLRSIDNGIAQKIFPLDILSAAVLTLALQRYGQNERSLFTFLNSQELNKFRNNETENHYYNIHNVYAYLKHNFGSFLSSRYNNDFIHWQSINYALQRAESLFGKDFVHYEKIITTIGLLSIFGSKGANVNKKFIEDYLNITSGITNCDKYLEKLESHKLIRYLIYKDSLVLFEGTDLDFEYELQHAGKYISDDKNVIDKLRKYFDLSPILAKANYFKYGTPRYFDFILSDSPVNKIPTGDIDGYINIIVSNDVSERKLKEFSESSEEAIIYGLIKNSEYIRKQIRELEKINYILGNIKDDKVAIKELNNLKNYHIGEVNKYLTNNLFTSNEFVEWYYEGKKISFNSARDFNKFLSTICEEKYHSAPIFRNELVNREKLPSNISRARKDLLSALISNWDQEDLGFAKEKFPPEKSIYLSLLKNTGIHKNTKSGSLLNEPVDKSYLPLWNICNKFLEDSKTTKKSIRDLIETLSARPFKLKSGFIEYWVPIWMFIMRNDYALYNNNIFIPDLNPDTVDLIIRKPEDYYIKAFDLGGIRLELFNKYRDIINKEAKEKINKATFIDTIKPFLAFYKSLPEYSKNTTRLTEKSIKLRSAISNAKDPEKTFFEDFPNALGYTTTELNNSTKKLEHFVSDLMSAIRELRICYSELIDRIESAIVEEFNMDKKSFPEYKNSVQNRYKDIKKYVLLPHQKTIYQRLNSNLDDRESWLNSFIQSLINKQISSIADNEEEMIYEKIESFKFEFDNLCEFANLGIDNQKEEVIKIEITKLDEKSSSGIITIPKNTNGKFKSIEKKIKQELMKNNSREERIFVLSKLLKEELNEE